MDNKSLLAIVLCILILIGYQSLISYLYPPPDPLQPQTQQPVVGSESATPSDQQAQLLAERRQTVIEQGEQTPALPQPASTTPSAPVEQDIIVETDTYIAVFTSTGGRLKSFRLKQYPVTLRPDSPLLEMVTAGTYGELPFVLDVSGKDITLSDAALPYVVEGVTAGKPLFVPAGNDGELVFSGSLANGARFTKTFTFSGEGYGIELTVAVTRLPFTASALSLSWLEGSRSEGKSAYYDVYGPVALIGRTFEYENAWDWEAGDAYGPGDIRWAGFTNSYFLAGMMPRDVETAQLFFRDEDGTLETRLSTPWSGQAVSYTLYLGPKDTTALNTVDPAFDRAIDFGWSHFIARPLVSLLRLLYGVTGNYGIAIILLTVLVKLVFFPLSNKSFKSMSAMKKLQPQMERLREQYKEDRQKLNQEMMELYKRYEVNPLGGCIPMIVQLPVFIGLYQGLLYAIELRQAPFFGWIEDLSQPDRLGALAIPFVDPPGIPVLTLLMGGSMVIQQMMMPTTGDPLQQKMMLLMPVIFTVMFINFPAGLVLYWLINNILSVAQQHWYTKTYG